MKIRSRFAAFAAGFALVAAYAAAASPAAFAQDKMGGGKMMDKKSGAMKSGKMAMTGKMVYACKGCKMYYSAADAKKMGMKDPMGHRLMRMSRADARKTGMTMAKMGKMGGDKMMGGGNMGGGNMGGGRP